MTAFLFVFRKFFAWVFLAGLAMAVFVGGLHLPATVVFGVMAVLIVIHVVKAFSHVQRVRLLTDRLDAAALANRQRRQVEIPFEAGEAFDLVEAAIRELPRVESVEPARDSLQVRALVSRPDPYDAGRKETGPWSGYPKGNKKRNFIHATVTPGNGTGSVTLLCEPEGGAWHGVDVQDMEHPRVCDPSRFHREFD